MQKRWSLRKLAQVTGLTLALLTVGSVGDVREAGADQDLKVIGLTDDGRLVKFRSKSPEQTRHIGVVTGLVGADTELIGIDFRVQDGLLYGVGNAGGIYTLDSETAAATLIDTLDTAPSGTAFGVDFNPAANALRIISDTGQNLRHRFSDLTLPTVVDTTLSLPPAAPPALGVTGAAYTNNDLSASTGTTLFDVDTTNNQLVLQSPANSGQLVPTGALGVDAGAVAGLDIYSQVAKTDMGNGPTVRNRALAVLTVSGATSLYKVDPLTGAAKKVDDFTDSVVDLAIRLNQ